ncbi:YIPF3 [Cordylochernes scorpioides]|uniref:YIPF3 n=1 Tax=Cordylochernes scorpioides TaxID=51811 RepID=A0ABY6KLZ6_9ARAC|nr:YIPF3 [Cordylochernes scorpioides]
MLVLTLIALLLYGMKTSDHVVKEGTLMGTAFGVSFGYWFGATGLVFFLCFISNCAISFFQLLSLVGYGISGHCLTLLLGTLIHPENSHISFYLLWLVFGGLSAATMVGFVMYGICG